MSLDAANLGVQQDLDSLIDEQILERGADVRILAASELRTIFDHGHIRAEPTKRLREFKADVPAAESQSNAWASDQAPAPRHASSA